MPAAKRKKIMPLPGGFPFLFVALLFMFFLFPLAELNSFFRIPLITLLYGGILYGLKSSGYSHKLIGSFSIFTIFTICMNFFFDPNQTILLNNIAIIMNIFLLTASGFLFLKYVLQDSEINIDKVFSAICVYFLMGLLWAFIFTFLAINTVQSFNYLGEPMIMKEGSFSRFFYYSIVTLTTLGYGDITPTTTAAKSMSAFEAFSGQLFLAVLIARLVGMHITQSTLKSKK